MMSPHDSPPITGLILAGGLGRRMGGIDKGLQLLDDRPLVAHVLERLEPQVSTVLINANRNADLYAGYGHPVVADQITGFAGPLAGIHAGLATCATPLLAIAPCDAPCLPGDLVDRLLEALMRSQAQMAIPETQSGLQPVFALMRRDVLPSLVTCLANGQHRMQDWCRALSLCVVNFPDERAFANINTLAELRSLGKSG